MVGPRSHRYVEVNGIRLHIAGQGQGSLIVLLHGWPESWHSWRHQFGALAAVGWRTIDDPAHFNRRGYRDMATLLRPADGGISIPTIIRGGLGPGANG